MAKVTIERISSPDIWHFEEAPELRIYANRTFISDEGILVLKGVVGSDEPHLKVACELNGTSLVIGDVEIDSTPTNPPVFYTAQFHVNGRKIDYFKDFAVPANPAGTTWEILRLYQQIGHQRFVNPPMAEIQSMVASMISVAITVTRRASATQYGMTALTYDPIDPSWPEAVSANDPLWLELLSTGLIQSQIPASEYGALADAVVIEDATISLLDPSTLTSATGGLTDSAIGKVIAIAGAGPGGQTLISLVAEVPTANTLTLGDPASTAVTNTRAVHGTDNTQFIQDALDAAEIHATGHTVQLARGNYLFSSSGGLTIPQGVTLQGSWDFAPDHLGYRYANEVRPMDGLGTTLVVVADEGTEDGQFILVNSEAGLLGVSIFQPAQLSTLTTPKLYPWAVRTFGAGPVAKHVELVNTWRGIYSHVGQRHRIEDIRGLPLSIGLYASQQLDTSTYKDIDFIGMYTYGNPEGSTTLSNLMAWVHQNGIAFKFGRVDNAVCYNLFSFGYYKGFKFVIDTAEVTSFALGSGAPGGRAWAEFTDCGADGCNYPVDIDDVQGHDVTGAMGVTFTNCMFNAAQIHVFSGPELYAVWCRSTMTGRLGLVNCRFHLANICIRHEAARLDVLGCYFQDWSVNAVSLGAGGTSAFTGNHFKQGSTNAVVDVDGSPWTSWSGNMFEYVDTDVWASLSATANFNESGNTYATSPIRVAVTFQAGWVNFGGALLPVTYIKRDGQVFLQGTMKNGTIGSGVAAFTLPTGYRPSASLLFGPTSNGLHGVVQVAASGVVSVEAGDNTSVSLDGISFMVR